MSVPSSRISRISTFDLEESSARRKKKAAAAGDTQSTLALVTTKPTSTSRAVAQYQGSERDRNSAQEMAEGRERRYARADDDERSDPTFNYQRPQYGRPGRHTTFPWAREDIRGPGRYFFNEGTVQNQVGGSQHVYDGMYSRGATNDAYHTGHWGQQEPSQSLRRSKTSVTAQDIQGESPLKQAAFFGELGTVKSIIRAGIDINDRGGMFDTALQAAAANGQAQTVFWLLQEGAEVNAVGGEFGSAIHAAAAAGCVYTVMMLLLAKADVHVTGGRYRTVIGAALSRRNNQEVTDVLLDAGASARA